MIPVQRLTVIGAGAMGSGIAQVAAASGFPVFLVDMSQKVLDKGTLSKVPWKVSHL